MRLQRHRAKGYGDEKDNFLAIGIYMIHLPLVFVLLYLIDTEYQ
jgi:hypothetical protein